MLITDLREIGNRMLSIRKNMGKTQAEIAEKAELSDRSYADIERGNTNLRLDTLVKICRALGVTPDALLVREGDSILQNESKMIEALIALPNREKRTALRLLSAYIESTK